MARATPIWLFLTLALTSPAFAQETPPTAASADAAPPPAAAAPAPPAATSVDTAPPSPTTAAAPSDTAPIAAAPDAAPPPAAAAPAPPDIAMQDPHLWFADIDWDAARANLAALVPASPPNEPADTTAADTLEQLNAAAAKFFPRIAQSPVPVLLPLDTAGLLHDSAQSTIGDGTKYFSGIHGTTMFFAGPSGYDAVLSLRPQDNTDLKVTFTNTVNVQITGSSMLYELDPPALVEQSGVTELDGAFTGIRRVLLESHLRYTFTRFGVPYAVSMECFDGAGRERRLSCRDADKVAVRVLKALNVAGGSPQSQAPHLAAPTIERPEATSPDFTFYAPGDLIPGSGMKDHDGRHDATVYAKIKFPLAQAPAYANSQSFMNWGDCDHTGRVSLEHGAGYRCRVNSKPLVEDESKNYAYPWRDNFCEHRYFYVGQCPAGLGHQGQDIRPSTCAFRVDGAGRCDPFQNDVVAVSDGVLMRAPGDRALYLVVDKPGEHIRVRYLHMDPKQLDAAGMVSGRAVSEGEVLGAVGDYGTSPGGTSYHLHFDVQVPTRDGWVFVSPYMTLVAAYERLIGARGSVVSDSMVAAAAGPDGRIDGASDAANPSGSPPRIDGESALQRNTVAAEHCAIRLVRGHRRQHCWTQAAPSHGRARHSHAARSTDQDAADDNRPPKHHRRATGHVRSSSRHGRA